MPNRVDPAVDVLGDVAPITPEPSTPPNDGVTTPEPSTSAPKWKKRKKSSARRLASVLMTAAVLVALGAGAWFGYQALASTEDSPPPVPLRERPDTIFGKTGDLVDEINERMPDQELLDDVLGGAGD
jgi:hypothetical protein